MFFFDFLMLISTHFFGSPGETTLLLHVMFWLSFVLNVVPILFFTIGCRMSTTSFIMFIPYLWEDFGLVFFFNFEITCSVKFSHAS